MKIALFAAVPEEVGHLKDKVNFSGIGRENATRSMVRFMEKFEHEDFLIINIGTVGSHKHEVGEILRIQEIISAGMPFNAERMMLKQLPFKEQDTHNGILYSSDCFVSPEVFTEEYLEHIKSKADCFDMESSALYTIAQAYGKKYVSYKIVSDNLNITIEVWKQRVLALSEILSSYIQGVIEEMGQEETIEFLLLEE